jgi:hypothetical protein
MDSPDSGPGFKILGVDDQLYGPVDLPGLVDWVKDERIVADTWIYRTDGDKWEKASHVPELAMFFRKVAGTMANTGLTSGKLRRVKALAEFSDSQLEEFAGYMEVVAVRQWTNVVTQGEVGDAMYLVLEGELRVRIGQTGSEKILATLGPGEAFGEMSIFDKGKRSADVVANIDSVVLKISAEAYERLLTSAPALAAPFIAALARTLAARIRSLDKKVENPYATGFN